MILFPPRIKKDFLKLAHVAYGGELYFQLKDYTLLDVPLPGSILEKVYDSAIKNRNYHEVFFSYKNIESGFSASVFKYRKRIVIAYRGTERTGMGENQLDYLAWTKDILTDINLITSGTDKQFDDAFSLYLAVRKAYPEAQIILTGHSLGGGLAQLVAARIYSSTITDKKPDKPETYTYNAPGCKHLLKTYKCKLDLNYDFITNYAVMNDWCGMYGEKIGKTYLIAPITIPKPESKTPLATFNSSLLATHEGIFDYSRKTHGKIIEKPADYTQAEGLSLWYYDKNNPLKDMDLASKFPKLPELKGKFSENILYTLSKLLEAIARQVSLESLEKANKIVAREVRR